MLAAGGDGTVRAVAEGLHRTEVPLVVLPTGTGNLLARNLEISLIHLEDAIRYAFTGTDRRIDVGIAEMDRPDGTHEDRVFVVMAGLGLDAQMIANTSPALKRRVGWLAYVQGIARSLRGSNNIRLRVKFDDEPTRSVRVHMLLAGNCGVLTGNVVLLPDAEIDDGVFDFVAFRPEGFIGWVQIGFKVFWENGVLRRSTVGRKLISRARQVRTLRYRKGVQMIVRPDEPQMFQLDGDSFGEISAVRTRLDAGSLIVRVAPNGAHPRPATSVA